MFAPQPINNKCNVVFHVGNFPKTEQVIDSQAWHEEIHTCIWDEQVHRDPHVRNKQ